MEKQTTKLEVTSVKLQWKLDESPDLSWIGEYSNTPKEGAISTGRSGRHYRWFNPANPEYGQAEFERMEGYENGNWQVLGIVATAEIAYDIGGGSKRLERLSSGGLWGIDSDSDQGYLKEVEQEQLEDLSSHLGHFGIEITANQLRELAEK
jgi:hypothetical protein